MVIILINSESFIQYCTRNIELITAKPLAISTDKSQLTKVNEGYVVYEVS